LQYLWICLATAAGTFAAYTLFVDQGFDDNSEVLNWADALGVGAFCVIGAQNAVRRKLSTAICVSCGMFTATFGGMMRDVLCQRPPRILHSQAEIYASTALVGAGTYMALRAVKASPMARIAGGFTAAVVLRVAAWKFGLRLPVWARSPAAQPSLSEVAQAEQEERAKQDAADAAAAAAAGGTAAAA
jgi:uncharacterized membrane protein YeiH